MHLIFIIGISPWFYLRREVPLEHPNYPAFAKLGLKWGAVPSITSENKQT